jgi:hypothetical protein
MGDAALHLDLFEQPARGRLFQHPAIPDATALPAGQTATRRD